MHILLSQRKNARMEGTGDHYELLVDGGYFFELFHTPIQSL